MKITSLVNYIAKVVANW